MKKITKRDLVIIQCVLAYEPNTVGITIKRYVSTDRVAPEYVTAIVSVPGLPREICVKVKREEDGQWTPISITTPRTTDGGTTYEVTKYYMVFGLGGKALRQR